MISDKPTVTPVQKFKPYKRKTDSKKYTAVCLTAIGIFLIGSGIAVIIVGLEHDIQDLLILGSIFLVAGIGFTVLMLYIIVTQIYEKKARKKLTKQNKKEKIANDKINKLDLHINSTIVHTESKPYIEDVENKLKETEHVHKLRSPTHKQLYGVSSVTGHVRPDEVQPIRLVEINQEPSVKTNNKNNDILADKTKSGPPKDELYGESVRFSLSTSPSPPPVTSHSSGSPTFSGDRKPSNEAESPVPSLMAYTLPNEVPDETMSHTGSPVPSVCVYTLPNDDINNADIESSHL